MAIDHELLPPMTPGPAGEITPFEDLGAQPAPFLYEDLAHAAIRDSLTLEPEEADSSIRRIIRTLDIMGIRPDGL